jgi:uncharacterized membrane protein YccC
VIGAGIPKRLRRRDPGFRIGLRAVRLTIAALPAYYACLYGVGNAVAATYIIFGVIAAGLFIQLPGPANVRARILLATVPASWILITLATVLDVTVWVAVLATFVVGFAVAFAGVAGPRAVGLAGGLLLFFVAANFPPHHAEALPARLIGTTVGMVLVAIGEVLLWPDPTPVPYQNRLADAMDAVAALLDASADVVAGVVVGREDGEIARRRHLAAEAVERMRMLGFPRAERPVSASRRDRALRDGAFAASEIAEQVRRFTARPEIGRHRDAEVAALIRGCAAAIRSAGRTLIGGGPPPGAGDGLGGADPGSAPGRAAEPPPADLDHLRLCASLRTIAAHVDIATAAARIATGQPVRLDGGQAPGGTGAFWYARHNAVFLVWAQLRVHLTPRSVFFQGALRLALALAATRLAAAELDLSHGFWALLGTLTVMRTSAVNTRSTLVHAIIGSLAGAMVTGLLLAFAGGTVPYAVELLIATLLAFAVGPLLGVAWAQGSLTIMITLVFAQLAPANWSLASVRFVDVLVGGAVGVVAGLLMWPRGASGELGGRVGTYLRTCADLIPETVAVLADRDQSRDRLPAALHTARHEFILADATLCQYYSERTEPRVARVRWEVSIGAGNHIVHGAELLLRHDPAGSLDPWPRATAVLTDAGRKLRRAYLDIAAELPAGRIYRPAAEAEDGATIADRTMDLATADGGRPVGTRLVEVTDWLAGVSENLDWIEASSDGRPRPGGSPVR